MRALRPYRSTPFSGFHNELARMFERNWPFSPEQEEDGLGADWAPAVDVQEEEKRFVVHADLPGVDPENIDVTVENGMLTIRGERKEERKNEREGYHRVERFSGSFFRRFALADAVDSEGVEARVDKGVLEVSIPKTGKSATRRIKVKH